MHCIKTFVFCLLILLCNVYGIWNPSDLIAVSLIREDNQSALENKSYLDLKEMVSSHLKDSWCSEEKISLLMDLVLLERPINCVEVGVFTGSSLLPVAAVLKYLRDGEVYAIDPWSNTEAARWMDPADPNRGWWSTVDMHDAYQAFLDMLDYHEVEAFCTVIRKPAEAASDQVPEIDFLHLDGNFSREGSMKDVQLYVPKVKQGGCILLSNLKYAVNNVLVKRDALAFALQTCSTICSIDKNDSILLRKN